MGELVGDMIALRAVQQELDRGWTGWTTDQSDDGRKLRDIAGGLGEWSTKRKDHANDSGDAKRDLFAQRKFDRYSLAVVGWVLVGKTLDEIRAGEGISGTEGRP
jgi:hypothetical protein